MTRRIIKQKAEKQNAIINAFASRLDRVVEVVTMDEERVERLAEGIDTFKYMQRGVASGTRS